MLRIKRGLNVRAYSVGDLDGMSLERAPSNSGVGGMHPCGAGTEVLENRRCAILILYVVAAEDDTTFVLPIFLGHFVKLDAANRH